MNLLKMAQTSGLALAVSLAAITASVAMEPSFGPPKLSPWGEPHHLPRPKAYSPPAAQGSRPFDLTPTPNYERPRAQPAPQLFKPYRDINKSLPKNCASNPVYISPNDPDYYANPGRCILK